MLVSRFREPASSRQVAIVDKASPFRLPPRIKAEDDLYRFTPVSFVLRGIQQACIGYEMALIVWRELSTDRRAVVENRYAHGQALC